MADHSPTHASATHVRCIVVTPEETVVDRETDFVALPLFDGELGVGLHHAPMIGRLGCGELRLKSGNVEERYYVDGGFVQVADDLVSVLTNRALPARKVDAAAVRSQLNAVTASPAAGDAALAIRDRQVKQLRAQLRVASKS